MAFELDRKRVLITGGTAGIGLAVARRFALHGAQVVICGRRDDGEDIASEIGAQFVRADMMVDSDINRLFSETKKLLGTVNVVINNAGIAYFTGDIWETDLADFDRIVNVNLRAAFQVLKLAPQYMVDGGTIINTASMSGLEGGSKLAVYAATKAALINLTKSSALELAPRNIRVNAVSPGPIRTEIWGDVDAETFAKVALPLARMGEVDECAAAFHFLAADDSAFITGTNLVVDGGYTCGLSQQLDALAGQAA